MNPMKRRTVIAGNWKMNFTPAQATAFINEIKPMVAGKDNCDIIFCAPYVTIAAAQEAAKGSNIKIGAENVHFAEKGAYTGEVSAEMLTSCGVEYVIIAYEPVWAIGTGVTATADQADEGNGYVRAAVAEMFGASVAEETIVQYGGSMNDKNAAELLSKENVDGGLIGGASLKTDKFTAIVKAANA